MQGSLTEGEGSVQLTSLHQLVLNQQIFIWKMLADFFRKKATLMRRSTVLSLSPLVSLSWPMPWLVKRLVDRFLLPLETRLFNLLKG
jgi:hypothetical protein